METDSNKAHELGFGLIAANLANAQGGTPSHPIQQQAVVSVPSAGPSGVLSESVDLTYSTVRLIFLYQGRACRSRESSTFAYSQ